MRHGVARLVLLTLSVTVFGFSTGETRSEISAEDPRPAVTIGFVYDGPWPVMDNLVANLKAELATLTDDEFRLMYPDHAVANGAWDIPTITAGLDRLLADDRVDIIVTPGLAGSQIACLRTEGFDKPVFAPVTVDIELQGLPRRGLGSGRRNLSYVALPDTLRDEIDTFLDVIPFKHIAFLSNREVVDAMPQLVDRTGPLLAGLDVEWSYVPLDATAATALDAIPDEADVVYVWPLLLGAAERQRLIDGFVEKGLPAFSSLGREEVEAGMFASIVGDSGVPRVARRTALNIQRVLLGDDPSEIPVEFSARKRLMINMATAQRIDVSPNWESLLEAEVFGETETIGRARLTLDAAVERSIAENLALAAERRFVEAGAEDVRRARSVLRPSVDATLARTRIDSDRAESLGGSQPEKTFVGSLGASQLIYSDAALASLEVEKRLQSARGHGLERLKLDTALDTATAYFNVLRAAALRDVQRNNVALTRSNLDLVRVRRSIGTAGAGEVFRWESQIALDRQNLVDAESKVRTAKIALNRLLHLPQETDHLIDQSDLDTSTFSAISSRYLEYISTPKHFRVLRDYVVQQGLEAAPELAQLDETIAAQRRSRKASRRARYLPQVRFDIALDNLIDDDGAGQAPSLPEGPNDTTWSATIAASYSLFTGGERRADLRQADAELRRFELDRGSLAEEIEQGIRLALIETRASRASVDLAQAAADASAKNLELVQDAYARGALSILDLLDAQNASLNADLNSANARYDFLIDLLAAQRAANRLDFFVDDRARQEWIEELDRFFRKQGLEPWIPRSR